MRKRTTKSQLCCCVRRKYLLDLYWFLLGTRSRYNSSSSATFSTPRWNSIVLLICWLSLDTCCRLHTRRKVIEIVEHQTHVWLVIIDKVANNFLFILYVYRQVIFLARFCTSLRKKICFKNFIAFNNANVSALSLMGLNRSTCYFWCKYLSFLSWITWIIHGISHYWIVYDLDREVLILGRPRFTKLRLLTWILTFKSSRSKRISSIESLESAIINR